MVQSKKQPPPAEPPPEDTGDVLELGGITKPPRLVTIEGVFYAMLNADTLGIGPRERLARLHERITALEGKGARITAKEEAEYDGRLLDLAKMILPDAPAEVMNKLSIGSRQTLVVDFLVTTAVESPRFQTLAKVSRSLGLKRSAGSNGHTPEPRSTTGTNGHRPK
jgi:hypothetical protein